MRIRSTKPEFYRSRTVALVDWEARFVLKALESYVDDNGVGKDDLELIASDTFPRDIAREGSRTLARLSEAIGSLHQAGLVWRYEADGVSLLYISSWESIQRIDKPQAGRFPRPDGTMNYRDSVIAESVANPREPSRTLAPGTGEQGNRGTGEEHTRPATPTEPRPAVAEPDGFADFWEAYPRKDDKGHARTAYGRALKKAKPDVLLAGAKRYAEANRETERRYIAQPTTWLNGERWGDEPAQRPQGRPEPKSSWDRVPNITELRLAGKL